MSEATAYRDLKSQSRFDPFQMPEELIAELNPEIVIRKAIKSLRVAGRTARARAAIEQIKGAIFLNEENSFYLPTHEIANLLKTILHKKISFAVSKLTGEQLSQTQKIRSSIIQGSTEFTYDQLTQALLAPIIDFTDDQFKLKNFESFHLKDLLPKAKVTSHDEIILNQRELGYILLNQFNCSTYTWISNNAAIEIAKIREYQLSNKSPHHKAEWQLAYSQPAVYWFSYQGKAALCLNQIKQELVEKILHEKLSLFTDLKTQKQVISIPKFILQDEFKRIEQLLSKENISAVSSQEFERIKNSSLKQAAARFKNQLFRQTKDLEINCHESRKDLINRLFPHQRVAVNFLLENQVAFLGDDMGLGKTLSVLASADILKSEKRNEALLVIAPNSLVNNWLREAKLWLPESKFVAIPQEKGARRKFFKDLHNQEYDGVIVNYECARLSDVLNELIKFCQNRKVWLCLDESQRIKNPRSRNFVALKKLVSCTNRRVLLSGTPTPCNLSDIWSQVYILDGGERFGKSYYRWLAQVANLGNRWSKYAVTSFKPIEKCEVIATVEELLLRRRKEEVINLPEKIFSLRDIQLHGEQLERYDEVRKDLLLRISKLNGEEYHRRIFSLLEEYLRAVQIASNPRLVDPNWKGEPAKFLELDEIVEEIVSERGEKIVIWTNYLKNVSELMLRYKKLGVAEFSGLIKPEARSQTVAQFQDPNNSLKILIALPAAGGVGITLTAAQTAIYLDKSWNAEHWLQSIDRIHRIGQTGTVSIISLQAGKVDQLIAANLARKERQLKEVLGDNKNRLETYYPTQAELIEALS